jgi:hypothetical protein
MSRFQVSETHFPLSPVDRRLRRVRALPRLMKLLLDFSGLSSSTSSSVGGLDRGALERNSFGRRTAGM